MTNVCLWKPQPSQITHSQMQKFIEYCNQQYALKLASYANLYQWSISHKADFWQAVANFCKIKFSQTATTILSPAQKIQHTKWFERATLNFAENLLSRDDNHVAIIFADENGQRRKLTYSELNQRVTETANELKNLGVDRHDRVVGFMPNCPETIIAMLATASLGAIWSSCSPDFGEQAVIDRFGQVAPKVLFAITEHTYKGKTFSHIEKIARIEKQIPSLVKTILIDPKKYLDSRRNANNLSTARDNGTIKFTQTPFDHPLYILFSSGTTGKPKCMVHGAGNTLIQHLKELRLHTDLTEKDVLFFNTTCGWMMWNWMVSSLAVGATIVLFEGSPFHPAPTSLIDLIDEFGVTIFGIGAKYFEALQKYNIEPAKTHKLNSLKTILTTGSPLLPTSFDYIYKKIKSDIRVSSISGGSDIISCFALGNPILPVYRGELQCIGLGMQVEIFDENAKPVIEQKGELVCTAPFPSMPIYFWNDEDGAKYQKAYFERYPNIWAHGDYAEITQHNGMIIYGRSDATLNPGGVRIGTAEIYNQVEKIIEIQDCVAVGKIESGDEIIILFVVLKPNYVLDNELIAKIKNQIRDNTSPFHVPAKIIAAPDLPRTISGKISELAVKKLIHGEKIDNQDSLINPDCLEFFRKLPL